MTRLLTRLWRDERGIESLEIAIAAGLFALIAGFGLFVLGDALADYFAQMGAEFAPPATGG
jgi:Flp pilus assembly pilin Flp